MNISIQQLMEQSGVKFGTSGARGLVIELTDRIAYAYTRGFLQFLESIGELRRQNEEVLVGGDLRPSTGRIMEAVLRGIADAGYQPVSCGRIPSPALALRGLQLRVPAIMVTGSHIPDDRNGIKFNKCSGEVLKEDESGITSQTLELDDALFGEDGQFRLDPSTPAASERPVRADALRAYLGRYATAFPSDALGGMRLGVYQHSAVGRDVIAEILQSLGAEVALLGRSENFIPVDTEAIRDEDVRLAREWAAGGNLDAIVSADGDSDRPLVSDERGEWLRGDVAGILCARFLGADSVSTPVSCNTAVEKCGWFQEVRRTRIGSPYVVSSMTAASASGASGVVGYEANGGFLLNSDVTIEGRALPALPTRDAVIVMLGVLLLARREGRTVSQLVASLPPRFTASDRLKDFPTEKSKAILARFDTGDPLADLKALNLVFGRDFGKAVQVERTDGVRVTFENGDILHLRPSGNAPEFRCYTEAASDARARQLNQRGLELLRQMADGNFPPPWRIEAVLLLILGLCFAIASGAIVTSLVSRGFPDLKPPDKNFMAFLVGTISLHGMAVALTQPFLAYHGVSWRSFLGLDRCRPKRALQAGLVTAAVAIPLALGLSKLCEVILEGLQTEVVQQQTLKIIQLSPASWQRVFFGLAAIVMAPVAEEIIFRGIIYRTIRDRGYPMLALAGSSLLFGAIHVNLPTFVPLTCLAMAFAILYDRTGSLLASMAAHSLFNAVNFALFLVSQK